MLVLLMLRAGRANGWGKNSHLIKTLCINRVCPFRTIIVQRELFEV